MSIENGPDELSKLENRTEVLAPNGSFEKTAKKPVSPGSFYASVEEMLPELAATSPEVSGDVEDSTGAAFPVDRRDFMRLFGAGAVATAATGCISRPVEKAIPYANQPNDQIPGVPTYYASTCNQCPAACGIVVKTREGRPVKIDGNPSHHISQGGLCGLGQASIQGLYHPERSNGPKVKFGKKHVTVKWDEAYDHLVAKLGTGQRIGILTSGSTGSRHEFFRKFLKSMGSPESNLYTWEPNGLFQSISDAHQIAFGSAMLPRLEMRHASLIVGLGSDFLDVGVSPVYQAKSFGQVHAYRRGRMGKLVQFESTMSLTGGRADTRHPIPVGSELLAALVLLKAVYDNPKAKGTEQEKQKVKELLDQHAGLISGAAGIVESGGVIFTDLAEDLLKGQSLVLAGGSTNFDENSTALQVASIMINILIGAYGKSLVLDRGAMLSPVKSGDLRRFQEESANLDVVFIVDSNPVFNVPASWGLTKTLDAMKTVVSIQPFPNETDLVADYAFPNHHMLESWGDEQPVKGFFSVRQPAVRPVTNSRQAEDMFLWIAAKAGKNMPFADYRAYLQEEWKNTFAYIGLKVSYDVFYQGFLRRGHIGKWLKEPPVTLASVKDRFRISNKLKSVQNSGLKLVASYDHRFHEGRGSHLPVLHEVGDGMTTITWDSWVGINPYTCRKLKVKRNDMVKITGAGGSFEVAVFPMPGLHPDTIEVPRGLGHARGLSKISDGVGVDPLIAFGKTEDSQTGHPTTSGELVTVTPTGKRYRLATMQKHNDLDDRREIVKRISLSTAQKNVGKTVDLDTVPDLYPKLPVAKHNWGMAFDLNKCTGCGSCMVACAVENNVPQVGREQINMGREMHWIRLDRYFHGSVNNPQVTFQPVTCQHCKHAPCEAVCPVFATTHDPEGLNAMTYNRCVGTRYCANACPYKVRRFNWWTHKWGEMGERQQDRNPRALNPDVTVRTRGVMEKCNMCVGRLRDAKHRAKEWGRDQVRDGDVKVACQQTCPSDAIVFGNLNDPRSRIHAARKDQRAYLMLGGDPEHGHYGIKTLPNVSYLADVLHESGVQKGDGHGASGGGGQHG